MLFHTQYFLLFFAVVFILYWVSPTYKIKHAILLIASLTFYMLWNVPLVSLLLISSIIDFYSGKYVWKTRRKRWLYLSLFTNLGILGFFKYANFGAQSVINISRTFGWEPPHLALNIILPLGISFYTFQSMSYTIDMYQRKYEPYQSLLDFALFVTFFPQLIAGPIVRADHFMRQLKREMPLRWALINQGIILFVIGAFKKIVLADQAAIFVNAVFGRPSEYTCFMAVVGVAAFSFQIYFDFSAYTDMARGLGYMLGYQLPENFLYPYRALGIRDFWRKWHLSLSSWLKDYLYVPLGGSRRGVWRTKVNLMATMLLGGLWHGAGWNFVIWGGIHGFWLSIEDLIFKKRSLKQKSVFLNILIGLATYIIVCFAWVFFRSQTFDQAIEMFKAIGTIPEGAFFHQAGHFKIQNWLLGIISPALFVIISAFRPVDKTLKSYPLLIAVGMITAMIIIAAIVGGGANEFIYFQF